MGAGPAHRRARGRLQFKHVPLLRERDFRGLGLRYFIRRTAAGGSGLPWSKAGCAHVATADPDVRCELGWNRGGLHPMNSAGFNQRKRRERLS